MIYHDHEHRVTYAETDKMGFVYYANYLVWFETGRTELIRASGLPYRELEEMGLYLPVIEAACRYKRPARYDEVVTIRTAISEFEGIRIEFSYQILKDGQTIAEGNTLHAFMDKDGRPKKLPHEIKLKLQAAITN